MSDNGSTSKKGLRRVILLMVVLITLATVRGVVSAIKGRSEPNGLSWAVWAGCNVIMLISALHSRIDISTLLLLQFYTAGAMAMAFVGLKHLERLDKLEGLAILIAVASLIGWLASDDATVALGLMIVAHSCGSGVNIRSALSDPQSEDRWMWVLYVVGNLANLLAISWQGWESWAFPVYETGVCLTILLIATLKPR